MKKLIVLLFLLPTFVFAKTEQFSVMVFNIWQEGEMVKGGYDAIVENIDRVNPDAVMLVEVRNYKNVDFVAKLRQSLRERGKLYYGERGEEDVAILTKVKPEYQDNIHPEVDDRGSAIKSVIQVGDRKVALYSLHLDYTHYACVLPRGYCGATWKKLDGPIVDPQKVIEANQLSGRTITVDAVIKDAQLEQEKGNLVIIGGDFNEPSHLDWTQKTKDLRGHNGAVIEWPCSKMLYEAGYIDSFRKKHANPVKFPGFTYPADNPLSEIKHLAWFPEADDRERIDFIYYSPLKGVKVKTSNVVGPAGDVAYNKRIPQEGKDQIILPYGDWPTDHKAVLSQFIIK